VHLEADLIALLWERLRLPVPRSFSAAETETQVALKGWADLSLLADLVGAQDQRLYGLDLKAIIAALGIPIRWVGSRPRRRLEDGSYLKAISATDVAFLLMWFERIGFRTDASALAERLRPTLVVASHLTLEASDILFHEANRHRLPPVAIGANLSGSTDFAGMRTERWTAPNGYRALYTANGAGEALSLEVQAPKYRKKPEPRLVTCPDCGMTYMAGLREGGLAHRRNHARHVAVHEPKPEPYLIQALERDLDAAWVGSNSPKWKRAAMYERARQFQREFGYDFPQWEPPNGRDPEAIGFLFSDAEGRIVGACAFRPEWPGAPTWRLDWVWICPSERRRGHLTGQWDRFEQRFGHFAISEPISPAMASFLQKRGSSCRTFPLR